MTSSLSAHVGPTFLSVSLMITSTFLLQCKNFQYCFFLVGHILCFFHSHGVLEYFIERQNKIYWRCCIPEYKLHELFSSIFFFPNKSSRSIFHKENILLSILCRKFSKLGNMFFHFNVSDLGMNFIPRERTWIVAKFGQNIFERLWIPVGNTCFSKMFIGATSGE